MTQLGKSALSIHNHFSFARKFFTTSTEQTYHIIISKQASTHLTGMN